MSAPVTLPAGAWQAQALSPDEAARMLAGAPARGDALIAASRAMRRAGFWVGGVGVGVGLLGIAAACAVAFAWEPPAPDYVMVDRQTRELFRPVKAIDAPTVFSEDTARAALRDLVEYCEEYRWETAKRSSDRCALFLAPGEQERFAERFRGPEGPVRRLGYAGTATAESLSFTPQGQGRGRTEVWWVRYNRVEVANRTTTCRPWFVSVQFRWRPELRMSPEDRSINLGGLQATHYTSEPDPGRREC